jgi:adenosylcobinamide hydrolase
MRVREAVLYGLPEALKRHDAAESSGTPSFFIFSRFKGEHWVEWTPQDCPYFPCHFPGQRCDFCYCPFYPCDDEELGEWTESSKGGKVWNCAHCTLLHEPQIADYLKKFPMASRHELQRLQEEIKR